MKVRGLALVLLLTLLVDAPAFAHEGATRALAVLDQRLALHPDDTGLLVERALERRRTGQFVAALGDLERAEALEPGRADVSLERALTLAEAGQEEAALHELDTLSARGSAPRIALLTRSRLLEARGRLHEARADVDAARRLHLDPDVVLTLGRLDEALGDLPAAAAGYELGLAALSGAVSIRLALIRVEAARGGHPRAIALVDEVLGTAAVRADWLLLRADLEAGRGHLAEARRDRDEALREVEESLRRRPSDHGRELRARALSALGRRGSKPGGAR
jgi:tetratricopeptide (TPR) repeat protein